MRILKNRTVLFLVVIFSVNIKSLSQVVGDSCFLKGKTFWSIFDSLGEGNTWQTELSKQTGAIFYGDLNKKNLSYGGTSSSAESVIGSLGRAKKLVALKDSLPIDIVMFENVNDLNVINDAKKIGTIKDEPWMQGEKFVAAKAPMDNFASAKAFCNSNISSILESVPIDERAAGSMLTFPYRNSKINGYDIEVESKASANGEFYIFIDGVRQAIGVTTAMSIDDIVKKIVNHYYTLSGWVAINNGDNSVNISYYTNTTKQVTFDDNSTGVKVVITETNRTNEYVYFYRGEDKEDWYDLSKWTDNITLYSCYKGLFEYLRRNLPDADLYLVLPTYYKVDFNDVSLKNDDGTYNEELHYNSSTQVSWRKLMDVQCAVAKLYDVPVLDVCNNSDINLQNIETYYKSNDVHPRNSGYIEWANTLCSMLREIYYKPEVEIVVNQYGCATYCSPYALDFSNVEGLKAYSAIGYKPSTQVVTLARVMTTGAGQGVFIKGEPGEYTVPVIDNFDEYTLNMLVGTLKQTTVNSTDGAMSNYKFTIADGDEAPMFYPFEDNTTFSAGKAYLQIPTAWLPATAQKSVSIRFDEGETTDIDEVKGESGEVKTIYDLQGRVVENPTSGIYIINGKKVFIK